MRAAKSGVVFFTITIRKIVYVHNNKNAAPKQTTPMFPLYAIPARSYAKRRTYCVKKKPMTMKMKSSRNV